MITGTKKISITLTQFDTAISIFYTIYYYRTRAKRICNQVSDMGRGNALLSSPLIDHTQQEVVEELVDRQICKFCQSYPVEKATFFCEKRGKLVTKRTGIRLYCFVPIDDKELNRRRDYERSRYVYYRNIATLNWREIHKEEVRLYRKRYGENNREELREKSKIYREANRERENNRSAKWYAEHKDGLTEYRQIRNIIDSLNPVYKVIRRFRHYDRKERKLYQKEKKRRENMMRVPFDTHLTIMDEQVIKLLKEMGIIGNSENFYLKRDV